MIYIGQEFAKINGNILPLILFFIIAFFLFIGLYKILKFLKPKSHKQKLDEKRAKIQKYYDMEKEEKSQENEEKTIIIKREIPPFEGIIKEPIKQEETLHVNQKIQNMERQFFNHQKTTYTPKKSYWENKKRGDDYEEFVGKYYEKEGYQVTYHGYERGRKDGGIDLIAENENETLLIQCKAWKTATVKQKHVKEFIGNCTIFLENNPKIEKKIRRIFITSSEKEDRALTKYLHEHWGKIEFIIMPF